MSEEIEKISIIIESYKKSGAQIIKLHDKRQEISDQIKLFVKLREKLVNELRGLSIPTELAKAVYDLIKMHDDLKKAAEIKTGENAEYIYG